MELAPIIGSAIAAVGSITAALLGAGNRRRLSDVHESVQEALNGSESEPNKAPDSATID